MTVAHQTAEAAAGTYLTFQVGAQEYGVGILGVREIVGMLPITPVPGSPEAVLGVINLRGRVVPVLSLRTRFGMPQAPADPHNVIVIVEISGRSYGLAVDSVREVAVLGAGDLEPPPSYGLGVDAGMVRALGKSDGRVRVLLDLPRLLELDRMPTTGAPVTEHA